MENAMNRLSTLIKKIRNKGLHGSLRVLCERYFYYHWELLTLERPLALPVPCPIREERWPQVKITHELLPAFDKHFAAQLPAIRGLLSKDCNGYAHLDERGNVMMMVWVNEHDYYDDQLYRCWIRIPPDCIYQFAGECAAPYRGTGVVLLAQKMIWNEYQERGFKATRAVVNVRNDAALKMHVRLGFEEVGESTHVYCLLRLLHFHRHTSYHLPRLLHLRKGRLLSQAQASGRTEKESL
jgi:hypothetical protein